jgi:hypothetical protein
MPSALRSLAVLVFVSAVAILSAPACSQQGEGERCDFAKNGDLDCDSGFSCVKRAELAEGITDRCCPAANTETDSRCARGTPTTTTGGSGNTSTAGATSGGDASGGAGVEAAGGSPSVPAATDGGMSGGGTPAETEGGAAPADASGGKGGAD